MVILIHQLATRILNSYELRFTHHEEEPTVLSTRATVLTQG